MTDMSEAFPEPHNSDNQVPMLGRIGIELNRRLLTGQIAGTSHIEEYANPQTYERILALPENSQSASMHRRLTKHGLPIFPIIGIEAGQVLLSVPPDARSVAASLRFVARDVVGYAPTFRQIGDLLARSQASGIGLLGEYPGRSLLGGLAIATNDSNRYGSGVSIIPPYSFDESITKQGELATIRAELLTSSHFSPVQTDFLIRNVHEGWDEFRH
jgi:hypothetical protein